MATLRDVARHAQVSTASVSRVLNQEPVVSDATRERVERAIRDLNYKPNRIARSLRCRNSHIIALVVDSIANPFASEISQGVEGFLNPRAYDLFLYNTDHDHRKGLSYLEGLPSRMVDGVIYAASGLDLAGALQAQMNRLQTLGIPTVMVGWSLPGVHAVVSDDRAGMLAAVDHLMQMGHRSVAFLSGPPGSSVTEQRRAGFLEAMAAHHQDVPSDLVQRADCRMDMAVTATEALVGRAQAPTAIVAGNDLMALGALYAAHQCAVRVPEDLSVVGFDNIAFTAYTSPPLTTVNVPKQQFGASAARRLLDLIAAEAKLEPMVEVLATQLVVRASCQAARQPVGI